MNVDRAHRMSVLTIQCALLINNASGALKGRSGAPGMWTYGVPHIAVSMVISTFEPTTKAHWMLKNVHCVKRNIWGGKNECPVCETEHPVCLYANIWRALLVLKFSLVFLLINSLLKIEQLQRVHRKIWNHFPSVSLGVTGPNSHTSLVTISLSALVYDVKICGINLVEWEN